MILLLLLSQFFNPSVLRTPPLYFAVHNTGEEDCNAVFFPILFCSAPQCYGTRQGEREIHYPIPVIEGIHTSPLCFAQQNIGEKQRSDSDEEGDWKDDMPRIV